MKPLEWQSKILNRNGLTVPDGRPLYQYRITDEEFKELTGLIKSTAERGLVNSSKKILMWDALMVMYAAEWWRRYYSGQFGFEGIFDSVGFKQEELSIGARNRLVEIGLQRWGRSIREINGRRQFLGTIATEGGLPLRHLSESGGWLKRILSPVLKKHLNRGLIINNLINAYQDYIPTTYCSSELNQILEDIVQTISQLRSEYDLEGKDKPIEWLDQNVTGWRRLFPLPIDDDSAISLLSELVDVASKSVHSVEVFDNVFEIERFIEKYSGDFKLFGRIDLPSYIPLSLLENIDREALPGRVEIEVVADSGYTWQWAKGIRTIIKGEESYKFFGRPLNVEPDYSLQGFSIRAKSMGETVFELPVSYGECLQEDSPWLLKDLGHRYEYYGSDSQNISDDSAIIYLPEQFKYDFSSEDSSFEKVGKFLQGSLYLLRGQVKCQLDGQLFLFNTCTDDSSISYEISGKRIENSQNPSIVFIGLPEVFAVNRLSGIRKRVNSSHVLVKMTGKNESWKSLNDASDGVYEVRVMESGIVRWSRRVGILSDDFQVKSIPDKDTPQKGYLSLVTSHNNEVNVAAYNCDVTMDNDINGLKISLSARDAVPSNIKLTISPAHSFREITLNVPFPSSGALLFDPGGNSLSASASLDLYNLYGYRLHIYDDRYCEGKTASLTFSLLDPELSHSDRKDIYIEKKFKLKGPITEVALIDWRSTLENVLGVGSLDSSVQVELSINGQGKFKLKFFRYQNVLEGDWERGEVALDGNSLKMLDVESLASVSLKALKLNQPEQANIDLVPKLTQDVPVGRWDFSPELREEGLWLIYPDITSSIKFRPLLWINAQVKAKDNFDVSETKTLPQAIAIDDQVMREEAIRLVLNQMADNLDHKSWEYLRHLLQKTNHLPLAAFDIWKYSVSEPKFLASLFVKTGFEELVKRIEEELPITWELVRLTDWLSALSKIKSDLLESVSDNEGDVDEGALAAVTSIVSRKIRSIEDLSSSMTCVAKILKLKILNEADRELELMSQPIDSFVKHQISSELQSLLRRQSESNWPEMLSYQIRSLYSKLPAVLRSLISVPNSFQEAVAFLPLILSWRINTDAEYGWLGNAVNIFKIVEIKEFDEDWFNAVFNFTSGWIYQHRHEFKEIENYA